MERNQMLRLEQLLAGIVFYLAASGIADAAGTAADVSAPSARSAATLSRDVSYEEELAYRQAASFAELQKRAGAPASADAAAGAVVVSTEPGASARAAPAESAAFAAPAAAREPSSWMMLIVGLVVAGFMARRISGAGSL
jgi:hypothetical protein